ncbi:hypothetical protein M427DRAFT_132224 [Gonapodya prolifera JEL478]|uniref:Peregrin n=1 Tax=Gonapodya prolifera (strain JEL478) TaxID=1344416 RepID=A0A139AR58_GONPJ|nr:hypothetical protein M427DRAFT_132224 [Gonapodya prolifera JEL478]|eukprot:KXS19202.1 hypothetical protein M427DRAFT_132224 [Gonapodya prolifera JEL478]
MEKATSRGRPGRPPKRSKDSKRRKRSPGKKRHERHETPHTADKPREEESFSTYFPDLDIYKPLKVVRINGLPGPEDEKVSPLPIIAEDPHKEVTHLSRVLSPDPNMDGDSSSNQRSKQNGIGCVKTTRKLDATANGVLLQANGQKNDVNSYYDASSGASRLGDQETSSDFHPSDVPNGNRNVSDSNPPETPTMNGARHDGNGYCITEDVAGSAHLNANNHEQLWTSDGVEATDEDENIDADIDEIKVRIFEIKSQDDGQMTELDESADFTDHPQSTDSDEDVLVPGFKRRLQRLKQRQFENIKGPNGCDEASIADVPEVIVGDPGVEKMEKRQPYRKLVAQKKRAVSSKELAIHEPTSQNDMDTSDDNESNLRAELNPVILEPSLPPLLDEITRARIRNLPRASFREFAFEAQLPDFENQKKYDFELSSETYIRYTDPTEASLLEKVEYDLDEQDKAWLTIVNEERLEQGEPEVSEAVLELVIDRFEKEWFVLTRDLPKSRDEGLFPEDMVCAICDDGEAENANAIVFCDGCNLAVHQDCYGVPFIPEGQWLCRKCMLSPEKTVTCILCPNEGGAFKQTNTNRWAHLLCAIWIPEVGIGNLVTMEPIDNIERIPKSRWKLGCYICKNKSGCSIQCAHRSCFQAFHVTCARRAKLFMKMKSREGEENDKMLKAYCDKHAPDEWRAENDMDRNIETIQEELAGRKRKREGSKADSSGVAENGVDTAHGDTKKASTSSRQPNHNRSKNDREKDFPPRSEDAVTHCVIPQAILTKVFNGMQKQQIRRKQQFLMAVAKYWALKRESRRGAPLLKRLHLEPWTATSSLLRDDGDDPLRRVEVLWQLRRDLEKVRMLVELVRKRERAKLRISQLQAEYLEHIMFPMTRLMSSCLGEISKLDKQDYFAHPVSVFDVPDYLDVIMNPMDLGTISEKIRKKEYLDIETFEADLQLIWDNAATYNTKDTPWFRAAERIRNASRPLLLKLRDEVQALRLEPALGGALRVEPEQQLFEFEYMEEEDNGDITIMATTTTSDASIAGAQKHNKHAHLEESTETKLKSALKYSNIVEDTMETDRNLGDYVTTTSKTDSSPTLKRRKLSGRKESTPNNHQGTSAVAVQAHESDGAAPSAGDGRQRRSTKNRHVEDAISELGNGFPPADAAQSSMVSVQEKGHSEWKEQLDEDASDNGRRLRSKAPDVTYNDAKSTINDGSFGGTRSTAVSGGASFDKPFSFKYSSPPSRKAADSALSKLHAASAPYRQKSPLKGKVSESLRIVNSFSAFGFPLPKFPPSDFDGNPVLAQILNQRPKRRAGTK